MDKVLELVAADGRLAPDKVGDVSEAMKLLATFWHIKIQEKALAIAIEQIEPAMSILLKQYYSVLDSMDAYIEAVIEAKQAAVAFRDAIIVQTKFQEFNSRFGKQLQDAINSSYSND